VKRIRGAWKRNTGQVLIIFVLAVPVLLGMSALVVDLGNLFAQKRNLQKAADASALAATQALPPGGLPPVTGPCDSGSPCETNVAQFASNFSTGNGQSTTPLPRCDTSASITTNCYDLLDISETVCPATGPTSTTCVPVRVQVTLSRSITTFFGGIIGKRDWVVHAVARAIKVDEVVGATTVTTPESTTVVGGTTVTTPGTTTVTGGTTVTTPATTTAGKPALLFAKSTLCDYALKIGGANSQFGGAVITNGGVLVLSNDIQGDEMVWGHGVDQANCVQTKPADWKGIIREAPQYYDWPVPLPTCQPAGACTQGTNVLATSVSDGTVSRACTPFSSFNASNPQPGLYCSIAAITLPNNKDLIANPGFGFVAPAVTFKGQQYRGYDSLYSSYGGFVAFGYTQDVGSSGTGMGFRGSVFAPFGNVSFSGSSSSALCAGGAGGCGFIEAQTISLTGAKATWQGLGPGFGGTVTPGTTTVTGGTTNVTGGTTTVTGGTTTTTPGTTTVTGGTTVTKDLNLDK
jgi:hypothetical protein